MTLLLLFAGVDSRKRSPVTDEVAPPKPDTTAQIREQEERERQRQDDELAVRLISELFSD